VAEREGTVKGAAVTLLTVDVDQRVKGHFGRTSRCERRPDRIATWTFP
jgi:hypothetical protein